ncbi:major strawberry allergen Fra a 1-2-like [Andrographis paniculata]|uniref:major strawberry allergen Fra a 1-2-like n=1 Tax=Andrographis paniculata TaxID=175694 RepID=UPI0021E77EF4|nr:major strawberry allergen Fra a 1-2-like [Andrographis paniculata]
MGVAIFTDENISSIAPARIFKASIVDSHNLIPKLMPQAIKSINILEGDGGAGTVKEINFAEESPLKSIKYRIDELDEKTFTYKYTLVEGDSLVDKLEKISYEVKFEQSADGGSISKVTSKYHTKGDFTLKEEEVKAGKERVLAMYKAVEAYLLKNPDAYV